MRTESSARFYELMSISVPDGTPEELIETSEAVAGYVTAAGGHVIRSSNDSPWGRRRLAYPIRHNSADLRDGFYTLYHFEIQPEGIENIEREIRLNERIIRHLLLSLDSEPIFVEEEEEVVAEAEAVEGEALEAAVAEVVAEAAVAEVVAEAVEADTPVEIVEIDAEPVDEAAPAVVEIAEAVATEEE